MLRPAIFLKRDDSRLSPPPCDRVVCVRPCERLLQGRETPLNRLYDLRKISPRASDPDLDPEGDADHLAKMLRVVVGGLDFHHVPKRSSRLPGEIGINKEH